VTLKELSQLLGLSPTTVSRALAGYPEVREATRRRVLEAARAHGYRPNRRAAALATGRAMSVGHVIPTSRNRDMVNPVFADFLAGAGAIYARAGYDLILSVVPDDDELDAYRHMAATRGVDGIVLHGPRLDDPRFEVLRETGLPFVVHGRGAAPRNYSFVDVDNRRAFARAARHLLDMGHTRIALLNGPEDMDFAQRRRTGFATEMVAAGAAVDPVLMFSGEMSEAAAHRAAGAMLDGRDPPTAFLVSSLIMAIGVRRAAGERGLRLGRDLSVVTHDDVLGYLPNGEETPLFTATRSPVREAGARCAEILLGAIAEPDRPPVQEVWESVLVIGASCGPPRRARTLDKTDRNL
jgi:LacI family transcriptional regulator